MQVEEKKTSGGETAGADGLGSMACGPVCQIFLVGEFPDTLGKCRKTMP